jgi:hypothetical protein
MSVLRFRKMPVVVEAMRWVSDMPDGYVQGVFDWLNDGGARWTLTDNARRITIATLEGDMVVSDGDWIIRGIKGEFYPRKNEIVLATYEPAEDDSVRGLRETEAP